MHECLMGRKIKYIKIRQIEVENNFLMGNMKYKRRKILNLVM